MTWGSFSVKTLGLFVIFWLLLFFFYGNFFLMDTIVPAEGMEVDEWIDGFRKCGGASGALGFICSAIWFYVGDNYAGDSNINVKYYLFFILSFVLGIIVNFVMLPASVEGSGLASIFVVIFPVILYYLASLFAYAAPVKYIPFLAEALHK